MRHFYRTHLTPGETMDAADVFFAALSLRATTTAHRSRTWRGVVGAPELTVTVRLTAKPEGGHYTFVEVVTDQMGESRVDRNVKRFFVELHRRADPAHALEAVY